MVGTSVGAKKAARTRSSGGSLLPEENPNIFPDRNLYGKVDIPFSESKNEEEVPKQIPIRKITKSGKPSTNVAKYTKSGKTYGENVDDDIKHVEKQIEWSKDQPLRLQYFKDKLKKL